MISFWIRTMFKGSFEVRVRVGCMVSVSIRFRCSFSNMVRMRVWFMFRFMLGLSSG
jgi:hypothetical protein